MDGQTDCGFCEKIHDSEQAAITEADAFTNDNHTDINDNPPVI